MPLALGAVAAACLVTSTAALLVFGSIVASAIALVYGLFFALSTGSFVYTTRRGKFEVWSHILDGLELRGDERVLDLGCGRGAVLFMVAQQLPRGRAVGVDVWKTTDQSGNAMDVTAWNAELEGVADRTDLRTADMRDLPFPDASFDLVLSSLAIHNIVDIEGRDRAIGEAVRVLKPGGSIVIADFRHAQRYAERLQALGMVEVSVRDAGWRGWYGGPWGATKIVRALRPV